MHHPSIDGVVAAVEGVCAGLGVEAYREVDGGGYLRYVCVNVERSTGGVQIMLVWNSKPYGDGGGGGDGKSNKGRKQLESLCDRMIQLGTNAKDDTSAKFKLHSLWVHHNAQWKHSASIFDF